MTRVVLPVLLALGLAGPAAAQDTAVEHPASREDAAWRTASAMLGDVVTPAAQGQLVLLAWHAAAAGLCPHLTLDHERFGAAYAAVEHADMSSLSDAEHAYFRHHLAVNFGVAVGIMLAEHAGTPEEIAAFCEAAEHYALDPAEGAYFDTEGLAAAE